MLTRLLECSSLGLMRRYRADELILDRHSVEAVFAVANDENRVLLGGLERRARHLEQSDLGILRADLESAGGRIEIDVRGAHFETQSTEERVGPCVEIDVEPARVRRRLNGADSRLAFR